MSMHQPSTQTVDPSVSRPPRFVSLRTKFSVFFGLILVLSCSTLSWYFVEGRHTLLTENLHGMGTMLVNSVVHNGQFRYGALIAEDRATLKHFVESLIALDDVVYVVIRGSDGMILAQQNKLVRESAGTLTFTHERRYYPDEQIIKDLYGTPVETPRITPVGLSKDAILVAQPGTSEWSFLLSPLTEHLYDFAMPVVQQPPTDSSPSRFPLELDDSLIQTPLAPQVRGVIEIGISDARAKRELLIMIRHALILTGFIIGVGLLGTYLLTLRVTTPIRSLAAGARQLAKGDMPGPLTPTTLDEVGQLTRLFNTMTQSLQERNTAIQTNLEVIQRQIGQLSAVQQTSAAIASTLDLHQLLDTVLHLLMANLGFSRMLLMLRRDDRPVAYIAQVAGVPTEIKCAAQELEVPIQEGDSFIADLMVYGKPTYVQDLEAIAHRMHPRTVELARRVNVTSFVAVPLQSHSRILGFLAGDRETSPCTSEDLSILTTVASHVASAIDNAQAYGHLSELTQHLEQRIEERTLELSIANERLKDHDRRRSMFVSVASHELRTPMTAIRSFADNMLDGVAGALTERQRTYLTRIGHNLNRLTRIINQLLDWSRLDLQRDVLRFEPVCLRQLATLVVDNLRTVAEEKHIAIELQLPDELPGIHGDRDKLEQVLWNLIGNAIKFTPMHGTVTVIGDIPSQDHVRVCVADTGCGIAPEHLARIFDEFSKVPSGMPASQGAQLGLFITRSLITMHRGHIWAESIPGSGTRIFFTIPCHAREDEPAPTGVA